MSTYVDVYRYRDLFANLFRRALHAKYRGSEQHGGAATEASPAR